MSKLTKGCKVGKAQRMKNCCREIRIQQPNELGKIYRGFNTNTNEVESFMCIKLNKDIYENIMQKVYE